MRLVYVRDAEGNLHEHLEPAPDAAPIEPLDLEAALALLTRNEIGRVGFLSHGRPVILPVTYALDEQLIVFRTAPGSKLHIAETEVLPVAFEADEYDRGTGRGLSVVVHGPMDAVLNQVESARLDRLGVVPYADDIRRPRWVRIRPHKLQGWRFTGPPRTGRAG